MNAQKLVILAKKRLGSLILGALFVGALSFLFLVVSQKNFRSDMDLLVVQNQQGFSDYYALSKSADYLTSVLTESIYSEKFIDELDNSGLNVDAFLPQDKSQRLKTWAKTINISRNPSLGMIHVEVFGVTQKQTLEISNAMVNVITTKYFSFLGRGQDLDVRLLSGPIVEKNPSLTNIILAIVLGLVAGFIVTFIGAFYLENRNQKAVDKYFQKLADMQKKKSQEKEEYLESLKYIDKA